ncbi:siderophore-interacting protein [Planobispora rosea]|uniref:Siderophore-interacting protein n=1 Tax=Planobispora rosea TaxID=35762 RepID=A0A8J3WFJ6_PLARO|nr:siderophore-interacting protein [Planobispora rosea]GGS95746.1 siderophore-interacting protein [Planobispora rosea]GIH87485.1 siderophore-interacting protein [Planobispora rosea]
MSIEQSLEQAETRAAGSTAAEGEEIPSFRAFHLQVLRTRRLSPSFMRITFTGDDLDSFADNGFDQRVKVILPLADGTFTPIGDDSDWYLRWRALPEALRNPIRTYTVRAVRQEPLKPAELDIDFVLHGDTSPASRWATYAAPGHRVVVIGPNAAFPGPAGGQEWAPPAGTSRILLAGDETAVPAIASIAESLPADARARVLLEVPEAADALPLSVPPGVEVTWLPREGARHGDLLVPAVREALTGLGVSGGAQETLEDVDVDAEILWEVPEAAPRDGGFYAWLAGEAGVVKTLRRHLVQEAGVDRSSVAFMGYWRMGRSEID